MERGRHREPPPDQRHRHELRRTPAARVDPGRWRRRAARRGEDDGRDVWRRPARLPVRAERTDGRFLVLRGEARLVRPTRALAHGRCGSRRAAAARRRLQRRARGHRRVGSARLPRRDARVPAGAPGVRPTAHVGTGRRVSTAPCGARSLHVVGLPGREFPQELRHAHRPPAGDAARRRPDGVGRDRPRGAEG